MEDRNESRRRELEEILELRRSFGTLGRRLVNRQTPIRTSPKPTVIPLGTQSAKADPDAAAPPDEEEAQAREQEQEAREQEREREQEPDRSQQREPAEPDQEADQQPDQEPDQEPEAEPDQEVDQRADQQPELDWDRVSTAVRRIAPVVDESYRLQTQTAGQPFKIPDPPAARRRPPWPWLAGLVAVFALGIAVGQVVVQPSPRPAPPASSQAAPAASTPLSSAAPAPQASVPPSCLVTAQRADVLIDLLVRKARGIEVTRALHEYTLASQTCRKEASSR